MEMKVKFCTYKELAKAVGCSYQQIARIHAKKIISIYGIDTTRLPKTGVLPVHVCEQYFDVSNSICNQKEKIH